MAVTAVDYFVGSMQQNIQVPAWLQGRFDIAWIGIGRYRLFIIVVCAVLALALQWVLVRTRFGSRFVPPSTTGAWPAGSAWTSTASSSRPSSSAAALPGSAAPSVPRCSGSTRRSRSTFMIYFLIVCAVGGTTTITGPLLAALLLGIADVMGKYYVPKLGAFIVYTLMILILLVRPQGLFARAGAAR